jgi:pyrimidine deaminase RibD-like protein/uncharacterized protein with PQ loop repeat
MHIHDIIVEGVGFVSTACICATLVPQILQLLRTRDPNGLSLPTYLLYTLGNGAGLVYGLMIASAPVTVTSVITLGTSAFVTLLILRGPRRAAADHPEDDKALLQIASALAFLCPQSDSAFAVGAAIVDEHGVLRATGYSREWGETWHAEEIAIAKAQRAGVNLKRATLYTSLEPCSERKSRPAACVALVLQAGIPCVVFGAAEPPTFARGQGARELRSAGVEVRQLDCVQTAFEAANAHVLDTALVQDFAALLGMAIQSNGSRHRVSAVSYRGITEPLLEGSPWCSTMGELRSFCSQHLDTVRAINRSWRESGRFPHEAYAEWAHTWQQDSAA